MVKEEQFIQMMMFMKETLSKEFDKVKEVIHLMEYLSIKVNGWKICFAEKENFINMVLFSLMEIFSKV
jgi:hypothetical protein